MPKKARTLGQARHKHLLHTLNYGADKFMRKQLFRLTLLCLICLSISVVASAQVVSIPDFNLRVVIANKLGKALNANITVADMAWITDLDGTNGNIRNLTGLEHAINLKELWLQYNVISDLSPLAGLTRLTSIDLRNNSIFDISPLARLINLEVLGLARNNITNISSLARLTNLSVLALARNSITDISPLAGLGNLRELGLGQNNITNVSPLAGLIQLDVLWLPDNFISDLSPLVKNTGLGSGDEVNVQRNPLSALSFNRHIPTLQSRGVTVEFDQIVVPPKTVNIPDPNLRNTIEQVLRKAGAAIINADEMASLQVLDATNRNIYNLTGLEYATNLKELRLRYNVISELSPLAGLTQLTLMDLRDNSISDISPLARLTNLSVLGLARNNITNISPLAGLKNLRELGLGQNNITNISPLAGLVQLEVLWLPDNSISDISPLARITRLTELNLANNSISDLLPLVANTGLSNGDSVDVSGNPLSALSFNTHIPTLQSRGVIVEFDDIVTRPADVNGDGVVNIFDLVSAVSQFGKQGQNLAADVNGDGVVNIFDLVVIAGMFDGAAAAPPAQPQVRLTAVEVQGWLTDARTLEVKDPIMKRGIMVLEELLKSLAPTETQLLPNYPNPFNPETWIPYRLAEDAFVTLTIYDLNGQVVRTLEVGHRIASAYESRSKAIYWDGRNEIGEQVASGVYFYTLTAGRSGLSVPHRSDFSATRKMLILK